MSRALRERLSALPPGALVAACGFLISGVCLYCFLLVASHALGTAHYAPFAAFWPLLFVVGPGCFLPLEQEAGRAIAGRRALGQGAGPVVIRASEAAAALLLVLVLATSVGMSQISTRLFDGNALLGLALIAGLATNAAYYLGRGILAGNGRFGAYAVVLVIEGTARLLLALAMAISGVHDPGAFGLAMVAGSLVAIGTVVSRQRHWLDPGPTAAMGEISRALGWLLLASLLTQFLINAGPIAVKLLAAPSEEVAAGRFLNSVVIARVPLFMFQAVQAALLPRLARLLAAGRDREFRRTTATLLVAVLAIAVLMAAGGALLGPWTVRLLFGAGFELGHADLGLLALGSGLMMAALLLTQALIAAGKVPVVATGWALGSIVFAVVTAIGSHLLLRVEAGLLAGSTTAAAIMALPLASGLGAGSA